jgi:hypothetical protein
MLISDVPFDTLKSGTASKLESYLAKTPTLPREEELDFSWLVATSLMNDFDIDLDI